MASGQPKRPTLALVAERAGVSVMTASYTYSRPERVSPAARSSVLEAAADLGYAGPDPSARSLRRGSTLSLGVVLGEHLSYAFEDPGAGAFLAGVAEVCAEVGYAMTILPITGAEDDSARIAAAAVDGFIVWTTSDDDPVPGAVAATKRPAVIHGGPSLEGVGVVSIDNTAAARAIGDVVFAGARRPAIVSQPLTRERISTIARGPELEAASFPVTRDRLAGYRDAAEALGFAWEDVLVAVCGRNDVQEAERLATRLLSLPEPPDAVAAMSDQQAVGVLSAAAALGRDIPGDLVLSGWDDAPTAAQYGLTTVAQSLRDQGVACARAALGEETEPMSAAWSIVERSSTGR